MVGKGSRDEIKNYNVAESLRDQRSVTIRAIRPEDKGMVIDALNKVSADSLYCRFIMTKKKFNDYELEQVTEVDFLNVVALVAVLEKDGKEQIAGGGRYIRIGPSGAGQSAEVAFLIADSFQGLGIASRLFKHLVSIARDSEITQFEAEMLPSNEAMLRVFSRSGIPVTRTATHDSVHVLMDLAREKKGSALARKPG